MMATRLFGFYRASDANDPETFIAGAAAMLANYPEPIVMKVCDPVRGLPSTSPFLPAIAEIRLACEREMVWFDAVERRDRERRRTAKVLEPPPLITADERRRVLDYAAKTRAELAAMAEPRRIDFSPPRSLAEAEASRRCFEARLPELKAECAANPPTLSAAMREAFARGGNRRAADAQGETDP
jgi:hypothetical protein